VKLQVVWMRKETIGLVTISANFRQEISGHCGRPSDRSASGRTVCPLIIELFFWDAGGGKRGDGARQSRLTENWG
jgi:hypothetical protein